jgi:uncharacterized protein DUF4123/FHA domain-containing protein
VARDPLFLLEICRGPEAGRKAALRPGQAVRVGRTERATLIIAGDPRLSGVHFTIDWAGPSPRIKNLDPAGGTEVNGVAITEGVLKHGDWIHAGSTDFRVHEAAVAARPGEGKMVAVRAAALERLDDERQPLFGVFDAARSDRIRELKGGSEERCRSLYDGPQADALAEAAPYLIELPRVSRLLELLVREGWTQRWGIYLTSDLPFDKVRRHLRRFLLVEDEETTEKVYFRFYDPATLRLFLPTCTPRQESTFFGEIGRFYAEGEAGEVLTFERPLPAEALPAAE